jgi:hypothetical protein
MISLIKIERRTPREFDIEVRRVIEEHPRAPNCVIPTEIIWAGGISAAGVGMHYEVVGALLVYDIAETEVITS